jgi:cytosine/adenosine deaminase-related metal-dependent hydrolase
MKSSIRAAWVAPMDRPVIRDGGVVVAGDRILAVGPSRALAAAHPDAIGVDYGEAVILPGLINAHVHLELSDVPRPVRAGRLADWLIEVIKASPGQEDAGRVGRAVAGGIAQCLRFGVTTVGDITRQPGLSRPVLAASPLRAVSFGEVQAMAGRRGLLEARLAAAVVRSHESDRLRVGVSPHAPYSIEPAGYQRCLDVARSTGMPVATHLAESADEAPFLAEHAGPFRELWGFLDAWDERVPRFAGGPIRLAKSIGLLDAPTLLAHVNYCDDAELELLAAGLASVVYCPRTHAYFGHPRHRWRDMLAAGVNVAVGTDSLASTPDLDVVDDLRLLRALAPEVPAGELWELVTIRAARALRMEDSVGSLTPGKAADLAIFPAAPAAAGDDPLSGVLETPVLPVQLWIGGTRVARAGAVG